MNIFIYMCVWVCMYVGACVNVCVCVLMCGVGVCMCSVCVVLAVLLLPW